LKNTHVVVEIDVGVDGRPKSVRVVKGTGDGSADDYFKNLVRGMRFSPAYSNGEPLENTISYSWDIGN
jgi:TonB family protein